MTRSKTARRHSEAFLRGQHARMDAPGMVLVLPLAVLALTALTPLGEPGLQAQERPERILGSELRVTPYGQGELRGELLAAEAGRIWMLERERGFVTVARDDIRQIRMQRPGWNTGRIWRWTLWAGGLTSAAMMMACTAESKAGGCGLFLVGWAGAWAAVGGIASYLVGSPRTIERSELEELRPWARFPQGLPEGYAPR